MLYFEIGSVFGPFCGYIDERCNRLQQGTPNSAIPSEKWANMCDFHFYSAVSVCIVDKTKTGEHYDKIRIGH